MIRQNVKGTELIIRLRIKLLKRTCLMEKTKNDAN